MPALPLQFRATNGRPAEVSSGSKPGCTDSGGGGPARTYERPRIDQNEGLACEEFSGGEVWTPGRPDICAGRFGIIIGRLWNATRLRPQQFEHAGYERDYALAGGAGVVPCEPSPPTGRWWLSGVEDFKPAVLPAWHIPG
eukprot:gene12071-biopygen3313